jgi:hypothetical protein
MNDPNHPASGSQPVVHARLEPAKLVPRALLVILCACVLCIILVAGLWPFHAPKNDVTWLPAGGLHLGRYGSLLSRGAFAASPENAGSIEVWLHPDRPRSARVILSFDSSSRPFFPWMLRQSKESLIVQEPNRDNDGTYHTAWRPVQGVFRGNQPVFVTVTTGPHTTDVYMDGVLARSFPVSGSSGDAISGRLIVGGSPNAADCWSGEILGLAVYARQLSPEQVAASYRSWRQNRRPAITESVAPAALYAFDEGGGNVVPNQEDTATDLLIPAHFFVLRPIFLRTPWREYRATFGYWKDVVINIGGFIPLGFCFVACFSLILGMKRAVAAAITFGFLTSLSIEILQFWLPTRGSGATDLITNTLGTAIGVGILQWSFVQQLLVRLRTLSPRQQTAE